MRLFVKLLFATILFFSFIKNGKAQVFLNGDFEINTAGGDQINLGNAAFNGFMPNTIAFGSFGDMDIIQSATYCGLAQNGSWYTALTGSGTDAITMQLSAPLVVGNCYTITFWDRGCVAFSSSTLPIEIGVTTTAGTFGTPVFTGPIPTNGTWTMRTATFVAPVAGAFISVQMPTGGLSDWSQIDNFTIVSCTAAPPVTNFSTSDNTICEADCISFTDLSTNSPTSWSWTFTGGTPATSTTQNPPSVCYATAGTYAVTLTATNASGSNTLTQTSYITVSPIDVATFNYSSTSFCQTDPNPTPTITGTTGGTFTSTAGLSITGTTGTINLLGSTPGTYTVTYTTSGACPATSTASVTISASTLATFNYAGPYCQDATDPSPTIGAGATAGTFTSTAGLSINSTTGVVDLSASTPGTYTVTNTTAASGSCPAASATAIITVSAIDVATFNYSSTSFCQTDPNPTPAITGTTGGTFTSTAGLSITGLTGTINLLGSTPGTYTVTYTTSGACPATATASVTISASTLATFNYAGPYCQDATDPSPTLGAGATAGTYTSTAGLSINSTTGVVDLSASTPGTYTVTNSTAASGSCPPATATAIIIVSPIDIATFNYSSTSFCQTDPNPTPTITGTTGGTFTSTAGLSITGSTGTINLLGSTPGTYTVTYTTSGACPATATASVTISASTLATFNYAGPYCQNVTDPSPTIGVGATAGTFTSTAGLSINSTTGVVDLSASTPGTYTITNTTAASGSCPSATATATITINAVPTPSITGTATICAGATTVLTASGGTTYLWSTGSTLATASVSPTATTTYTVTANNGGCTATATQTVTIAPPLTSSASATICQGSSFTLPSGNTASTSGVYSDTLNTTSGCDSIITTTLTVTPPPAGITSANICSGQTFTLPSGTVVSTAGTYTDTVTTIGGCDSIITTNLAVFTATAFAGLDDVIDYGSSTTLTASGGVSYSWSPASDLSSTSTASTIASPLTTTTYTVTVVSANGCTDSDEVTVFVDLPPCGGASVDLKTLIPNAFSPNDDGINDGLCIPKNPCIAKLSISIYDRWGEQVYESSSLEECWDGLYKGKKLDSAVFAYYFKVVFIDGTKGEGKGNISLVR